MNTSKTAWTSLSWRDIGLPSLENASHTKPPSTSSKDALPSNLLKTPSKTPQEESAPSKQTRSIALKKESPSLFDLSSHQRARTALDTALSLREKHCHFFVMGEERSHRMSATLGYLKAHIAHNAPPPDWIYVNNFHTPHKPLPIKLPNGMACKVRHAILEHVKTLETLFKKVFSSPTYMKKVDALTTHIEAKGAADILELKEFAARYDLDIVSDEEGFRVEAQPPREEDTSKPFVPTEKRSKQIAKVKDKLNRINLNLSLASRSVMKELHILQETLAKNTSKTLWRRLQRSYGAYLGSWIQAFEKDVLENLSLFLTEQEDQKEHHFERYSINVFVDNAREKHPKVLLESNVTKEALFGTIKYRSTMLGGYEPHFTLIRAGALHKAGGGILVLRAESLASNPEVWEALKGVLRDGSVRIGDHQREATSIPLMDAPAPMPIPLDVQVCIVGDPLWYYGIFFQDPDFTAYFKIKADMSSDVPINVENVACYTAILQDNTQRTHNQLLHTEAAQYLLRWSTRWTGKRSKMSSKCEIMYDIIAEAAVSASKGKGAITLEHIQNVLLKKRQRNASLEERIYESITEQTLSISTQGTAVGQVNALTVIESHDHSFGVPSRISARTYMGHEGVINIERLTEMSGPIQQKGTLILDGFLRQLFCQNQALSFSCSLTFEQTYHEVEGDSASLAELCAIASSLSDIPLRQDIAITGSMNQFGDAQAVGGVHQKVEGFFNICLAHGLTGTQGVIVPFANKNNLLLRADIVDAVRKGRFFIYAVHTVFDALQILMMDVKVGHPSAKPWDASSVLGRIEHVLNGYHAHNHPAPSSFFNFFKR